MQRRDRLDVGDVDEAERQPHRLALVGLVLELGERRPQVARRLEQLADLVDLVRVAVPLARTR